MRTLHILVALGSVSIFTAVSCSDDETAAPTSATQTSAVTNASATTDAATSTSMASAGGAAPATCLECLSSTNCSTENAACSADATCDAWTDCFNQCFLTMAADSCYVDCNETHAAAAALYNAVYDCMCTACSDLCGFCDLQGTGGGGTGGMNAGGNVSTGGAGGA